MKGETLTQQEIEIASQLLAVVEEERQTVIHCIYPIDPENPPIVRIWSTTFLIEYETGKRIPLLNAYNISFAPVWTMVNPFLPFYEFTLIFKGLSKSCTMFDLIEDIPEDGAFTIYNIQRNQSDVYQIRI